MSTIELTAKPILKLWLPEQISLLSLTALVVALLINPWGISTLVLFGGLVLAASDWYRMRRPRKATLYLVFGVIFITILSAAYNYLDLVSAFENNSQFLNCFGGLLTGLAIIYYLHLALRRDIVRLEQSFNIQPASGWAALLIVVIVILAIPFVQRGVKLATYIVATPRPETTSVFIGDGQPSITGSVHAWVDAPISQRHIALCKLEEDLLRPYYCELTALTATTDNQGKFQYESVPTGRYLALYDSGLTDFNVGIQDWAGKRVVGDSSITDVFWSNSPHDDSRRIYQPKNTDSDSFYWRNFNLTLMISGSPFIVAHDMRAASAYTEKDMGYILPHGVFVPTVIEVAAGRTSQVEFDVDYFGK